MLRRSIGFVVASHTPTQSLTGETKKYGRNHNILIGCGAAFAGRLACLCLNTVEDRYID